MDTRIPVLFSIIQEQFDRNQLYHTYTKLLVKLISLRVGNS